ncbi:MAG TPA: alpha-hydroxy acid oxidase, partial [Stellaceae bacterium]|nr:alpha-hydroxy acid oxidase [Stellaceae bacterium]
MSTSEQNMSVSTSAAGARPRAPILSETRPTSQVPRYLRRYLSLEDFHLAARRRLPWMLYGFISGGVETDATVRDNRSVFGEYAFVPRVLVDVTGRQRSTTIFGRTYAEPFGIAPMGASAIAAYRGDCALASAAGAAGIPMIVSAASLIPLEEIRRNGPTSWYQAYLPGDAARIEALVDRVAAAGFETLVLTTDVPVPSNRENNVRNGFSIPLQPSLRLLWQGATHPSWVLGTMLRTLLQHGMPHMENMDAVRGPPFLSRHLVRALGNRDGLTWEHLRLIRQRWKGKLVVKGILAKEDAQLARDCGADGIIVSNHGGRQLDGATSPLRVLPEIAAAAGGMTVMIDSGFRRGTDILKALALGADFVFLGRPFLYAAAAGGAAGVAHAINLLGEEISRDMALLGIASLDEIGPEFVTRIGGSAR